jgi:crotonobetainyl-CoA:carnitine CoA-transferase CaiB-like acyl-CoA transferase
MLESMLSLTLNEVQWSQFRWPPPSRPMFGPVETADGYVMMAIASEKTFQSLVTGGRSSGMDQRSALCEICRPPQATGRT